ncbi:Fic family protein [Raoultibacter phocaeensis]|uniref:Fic family protein n=1 Tax=Raoultibacter phocaeensis TaxID=2479841 RepID=UPI00111B7101|nr:Fic family protein [Raoultibacter phocaeensis]
MARYVDLHWKGDYEGLSRRERKGGLYRAYEPDVLAGRSFLLQGETAADIADAEHEILRLNGTASALRNTEALARMILRAEALSSSRIEGLVIGPRRILKAELGGAGADATAQEVLNNINAMSVALEHALESEITVDALCDIHRALTKETMIDRFSGVIRTEQNWLGGNAYNPCGASYVPPLPQRVLPLLEDLASFCNDNALSPLAQAAVAHAQFETIHPFVDGNGRVGRALVHVVLRRRGLSPNVVPPISLALATRAQEYVKELARFRHEGSFSDSDAVEGLNSWLSFFASCTLHACKNALEFERRIETIKSGWIGALGKAATSTDLLMADAMAGQPLFNATTMMQATGKTMPAVNSSIERFQKAGFVKQVNAGKRNRAFEAIGIIEAFTSFERNLASIADDTAVRKPERPVPFGS